jgi:hypothetical protein
MHAHQAAISIVLVAAVPSAKPAKPVDAVSAEFAEARQFVQVFYDWYVDRALRGDSSLNSWDRAVAERRSFFDDCIAAGLSIDSDARAKVDDRIVGLEFDPFLNSQDPADHYEARRVSHAGRHYFVEVVSVGANARSGTKPDVVVELRRTDTHWKFIDFYFPGHDGIPDQDLLGLLSLKRWRRSSQ